MCKNDRLKAIFDYVKSVGMVKTYGDFAKLLNMDPASVSRIVSGKQAISDKSLRHINELFGNKFNEQWLILGSGEMLKSTPVQEVSDNSGSVFVNYSINARLVDALIAQQSHLTKSQEQIDRLLTLLEQRDKK